MTLKEKLLEFFWSNQCEELTLDDIAVKFGASKRTVEKVVADLRQESILETVHVVRLKK